MKKTGFNLDPKFFCKDEPMLVEYVGGGAEDPEGGAAVPRRRSVHPHAPTGTCLSTTWVLTMKCYILYVHSVLPNRYSEFSLKLYKTSCTYGRKYI